MQLTLHANATPSRRQEPISKRVSARLANWRRSSASAAGANATALPTPLAHAAPAVDQPLVGGRGVGLCLAHRARAAARRHHRGDAPCRQRQALAQRHSSLSQTARDQRTAAGRQAAVGAFEQAGVGFIHIDLEHLPALQRITSYAYVAIDRATRYVYLEIHRKRDARTAAAFLQRFLADFPQPVHTILTDNGSEFTDRFAVDKKNKPLDRPTSKHRGA
jgi:Integrase core domain